MRYLKSVPSSRRQQPWEDKNNRKMNRSPAALVIRSVGIVTSWVGELTVWFECTIEQSESEQGYSHLSSVTAVIACVKSAHSWHFNLDSKLLSTCILVCSCAPVELWDVTNCCPSSKSSCSSCFIEGTACGLGIDPVPQHAFVMDLQQW